MQIVADRMLALPKAAPMAAGRHWIKSACIAIKNLWADLDMAG
jgi:hypothetical protein